MIDFLLNVLVVVSVPIVVGGVLFLFLYVFKRQWYDFLVSLWWFHYYKALDEQKKKKKKDS